MSIGPPRAGTDAVGAASAVAFCETRQGFTDYLIALGIIESVSIFVMVFVLISA